MSPRELWDICKEGFMLSHCAPVFFSPFAGAPPEAITNNATLALVDTGLRQLLVTCCHVWHGFIDYADQHPGAQLATVFHSGYGQATVIKGNCSGPRMPRRWQVRSAGMSEAGDQVEERAPGIVNQGPLAATSGMKGWPRTRHRQASQRLWPCLRQVER